MIALDTNVLIYACDKSDSRRQQIALTLIESVSTRAVPRRLKRPETSISSTTCHSGTP